MRELVHAVFKTGSGSAVTMLLSVVSSKIMAIVLGPFGVGLYSLIQQLIQTVSTAGSVGSGNVVLTQGIASRRGRDREDFIVTAFWILVIGGFISSLSLVLFAPWVAPLVLGAADPASVGLVRWIALPVGLSVALVYLMGVLNGHLAIGRIVVIQLAGAGVSAALSYPISSAVNTGYHVAFVAMITLTLLTQIVVGFFRAHRYGYLQAIVENGFHFRLRRTAARSFFAVAGTMMITSVVATASLLFIRALIVQYYGVAGAGIFNVAWVVCMAYPAVILGSFGTYYLPKLSQTRDQEERSRLMNDVFRLTTVLLVPLELLVIVLKPLMIDILYSEEFYPSLVILRWMLVGIHLRAASWVFAMPMFSYADMKTHFWTGNLWYVGFVGLSLLSIVHMDTLEIIGVGFVVVYVAYLLYTIHYARFRYGFSVDRGSLIAWIVGLTLVVMASVVTWNEVEVDLTTASVFVLLGVAYLGLSVTKQERRRVGEMLKRALTGSS